jgi:hypothetical protein
MATILTSYTVVPELQHWYHNFLVNRSIVGKDRIPPPTNIPELYMPTNSFIEMLFNDNYCKDSYEYRYLYNQQGGNLCVPRIVFDRMQIYPGSFKYVEIDPAGDNIFALQPHDFTLLDALLQYRILTCDSTADLTCGVDSSATFALQVVDSTSVNFAYDSTAGIYILQASLGSLNTTLSKLIYLYLDFKVNGNFGKYDNEILVSNCQLVESCYESYLIDQYYKCMSSRGTPYNEEC